MVGTVIQVGTESQQKRVYRLKWSYLSNTLVGHADIRCKASNSINALNPQFTGVMFLKMYILFINKS